MKARRSHHLGSYFSIQVQDSDVLDQEGIRAGDEMYLEGRADLVLLLGWIRDLRRQSGSKQLHGWNSLYQEREECGRSG